MTKNSATFQLNYKMLYVAELSAMTPSLRVYLT